MPLIKGPSKKALQKNIETEMDAGKPKPQSLAIAYNVQRNSRKKMSHGGMVKPDMADEMDRPQSMAEAIMRKRKDKMMSEGGMVDEQVDIQSNAEEDPADLDELNEDAAEKELYDDSQLSAQPHDSNEHSADIEEDTHDMVNEIRKKLREKRGF